jgi:hypothetical protein
MRRPEYDLIFSDDPDDVLNAVQRSSDHGWQLCMDMVVANGIFYQWMVRFKDAGPDWDMLPDTSRQCTCTDPTHAGDDRNCAKHGRPAASKDLFCDGERIDTLETWLPCPQCGCELELLAAESHADLKCPLVFVMNCPDCQALLRIEVKHRPAFEAEIIRDEAGLAKRDGLVYLPRSRSEIESDTRPDVPTGLMQSMAAARSVAGSEAARAFRVLGVNVVDDDGMERNIRLVFDETLRALGKIEQLTERHALAMQIFGSQAQSIMPLVKKYEPDLRPAPSKPDTRGFGS